MAHTAGASVPLPAACVWPLPVPYPCDQFTSETWKQKKDLLSIAAKDDCQCVGQSMITCVIKLLPGTRMRHPETNGPVHAFILSALPDCLLLPHFPHKARLAFSCANKWLFIKMRN